MSHTGSIVKTLTFRKADLKLFRELVNRTVGNSPQEQGSRIELADL